MIEASFSSLTICTVSFGSKRFLEVNWKLTSFLNSREKLTWLVAENSPEHSSDALKLDDSNFKVFSGAKKNETKVWGSASYHHAAAMNKLLPHVKTRFVLFLDPDCYIIRSSWIRDILNHMQANHLSFFGVPWHPRHYSKDRYFPCVHCMFVDLHKVSLDTLDFSPSYDNIPAYSTSHSSVILSDSSEHHKVRTSKILGKISRISKSFLINFDILELEKRKQIGTSKDVSYLISERYKDNPEYKSECLIPFFNHDQTVISAFIEKFLPDNLCYVPKRNEYFTKKGFKDFGLADLDSYDWEEFFWKDSPFGFHVRSYPKRFNNKNFEDVFELLNQVLNLN